MSKALWPAVWDSLTRVAHLLGAQRAYRTYFAVLPVPTTTAKHAEFRGVPLTVYRLPKHWQELRPDSDTSSKSNTALTASSNSQNLGEALASVLAAGRL